MPIYDKNQSSIFFSKTTTKKEPQTHQVCSNDDHQFTLDHSTKRSKGITCASLSENYYKLNFERTELLNVDVSYLAQILYYPRPEKNDILAWPLCASGARCPLKEH